MDPMMQRVLELPAQLRWGIDVAVPEVPAADEVVIAGMGGSGMAGKVGALLAAASGRYVHVHQGYGLPAWVERRRPLLLAVSHSGNTEETLSAVGVARDLGLPAAVVASGGELGRIAADSGYPMLEVPGDMQPRAAVGYQASAVLRMLAAAGVIPDPRPELEEAAAVVELMLGGGTGAGFALGTDIAEALDHRVAVIYGGLGLAHLAAMRWKTQVNENAKMPAYASELPELDHNEIEGWTASPDLGMRHVAVVVLVDPGDHPRVLIRNRVTRETIIEQVTVAGVVEAQGDGTLARLFSLIAVGDVASVTMAERAGVDATEIPTLQGFKQRLRED